MATSLIQQRSFIAKRWLHAHEEDTEEERVYRPADYPFKPSRGRTGFDLSSKNHLTKVNISPVDRPYESSGQWRLTNDEAGNLLLILGDDSVDQRLRVLSVTSDRLVVQK